MVNLFKFYKKCKGGKSKENMKKTPKKENPEPRVKFNLTPTFHAKYEALSQQFASELSAVRCHHTPHTAHKISLPNKPDPEATWVFKDALARVAEVQRREENAKQRLAYAYMQPQEKGDESERTDRFLRAVHGSSKASSKAPSMSNSLIANANETLTAVGEHLEYGYRTPATHSTSLPSIDDLSRCNTAQTVHPNDDGWELQDMSMPPSKSTPYRQALRSSIQFIKSTDELSDDENIHDSRDPFRDHRRQGSSSVYSRDEDGNAYHLEPPVASYAPPRSGSPFRRHNSKLGVRPTPSQHGPSSFRPVASPSAPPMYLTPATPPRGKGRVFEDSPHKSIDNTRTPDTDSLFSARPQSAAFSEYTSDIGEFEENELEHVGYRRGRISNVRGGIVGAGVSQRESLASSFDGEIKRGRVAGAADRPAEYARDLTTNMGKSKAVDGIGLDRNHAHLNLQDMIQFAPSTSRAFEIELSQSSKNHNDLVKVAELDISKASKLYIHENKNLVDTKKPAIVRPGGLPQDSTGPITQIYDARDDIRARVMIKAKRNPFASSGREELRTHLSPEYCRMRINSDEDSEEE